MQSKKTGRIKKAGERGRKTAAGLFFLCLFCLGVLLGPAFSLKAQVPPALAPYVFESFIEQISVLRNGSVRINIVADVRSDPGVKEIKLTLPYRDGQSVSVEDCKIAEIGADGQSYNAVGERVSAEIEANSTIGSYKVSDNGSYLVLRLNAAVPKESLRRIEVSYMLYQSSRRWADVGEVNIAAYQGVPNIPVKKMGVLLSFEASVLPEEKEEFRLFQRDNLQRTGDLLRPETLDGFIRELGPAAAQLIKDWQPLFAYYGDDIPAQTDLRLRLMLPSVWLPRLQPEAEADEPMAKRIIREEENYRQMELRRFEYRLWARPWTFVLLAAAGLLFLIFHWYGLFELYKMARSKQSEAPDDLPPGIMAYLQDGKVKGNLLLAVTYQLAAQGFLQLDEQTVWRLDERVLPDEAKLEGHERVVLHWIWELAGGEDYFDLDELDSKLAAQPDRSAQVLARLKNMLDLYCAERGYVPLPGEKKPLLNHLIAAGVYLVLGLCLAWFGNFLLPLLLLPVAAFFLITAFTSSKYTRKGLMVLTRLRGYERFLAEIDHAGFSAEEMLARLDRDFPAAVALGTERAFLMNLRYVIPVSTLLESGFMRRYGFVKAQSTMSRFVERRGGLSARYIHALYSYLARQINRRQAGLQTALVRLNLRLFRDDDTDSGRPA